MVGSRRLVLISIIIGAVALVVVLATLLLDAGKQKSSNVCDDLMKYIVQNDDAKSYPLLSASMQSTTSKEAWRSTVNGLVPVFEKAAFDRMATQTLPKQDGDPDKSSRESLRYAVKNPAMSSSAVCDTYNDGKKVMVDGFVSQIQDESTDEQ